MTAQPSEKLTREQVEWMVEHAYPLQIMKGHDHQRFYQSVRLLAQSWLEQYEALERAAEWLDNDIDWRSPNPNEVKLLAMLREVLR